MESPFSTLFKPELTTVLHLIENSVELFPLVIQVLHRLHQESLDLPELRVLRQLIQCLQFHLKTECKREQVRVLRSQRAHHGMVIQDAPRLIPLDQSTQFLHFWALLLFALLLLGRAIDLIETGLIWIILLVAILYQQ